MANKYLNETGLSYFFKRLRTVFTSTVTYDSTNKKLVYWKRASANATADTSTDIVTLATLKTDMGLGNVANGAEVNQNAFSNVTVGSTTVSADTKTDTLTLVAGSNVTITPDATNDKITIAATDTVTTATTTGSGNAVTAITASNGALTVTKGATFLTAHQDISGKADKSTTVTNVAYDSTNKKITKTINGTTSDVVTLATMKTAMALNNVDNTADANKSVASAAKLTTVREIDGLSFDGSSSAYRFCYAESGTTTEDNIPVYSVRSDAGSIVTGPGTIIAVTFGGGTGSGQKKLRVYNTATSTYGDAFLMYKSNGQPLSEELGQHSAYVFVLRQDLNRSGWYAIGYYDEREVYYAMTQQQATAGSSTTSMLISPKVLSTTIANAVAGVTQISYQIVTSLPATGAAGTIYLIKDNTKNAYKEYIWITDKYELLGDTEIEIDTITNAEIDSLFS